MFTPLLLWQKARVFLLRGALVTTPLSYPRPVSLIWKSFCMKTHVQIHRNYWFLPANHAENSHMIWKHSFQIMCEVSAWSVAKNFNMSFWHWWFWFVLLMWICKMVWWDFKSQCCDHTWSHLVMWGAYWDLVLTWHSLLMLYIIWVFINASLSLEPQFCIWFWI